MLEHSMVMKRLLALGALALLAGAALVGCGSPASAASKATPTPTCPAAPQFQQATGTITAVSSNQMTVQTTKGSVLLTLTSRTRYAAQQKVGQSDIQDGLRVQVIVKDNGDGTYTATQVAIRQAAAGNGSGNGGPGGFPGKGTPTPGAGRGRGGNGTPVPANCRTGRGGGNGGPGNNNGGAEGGLPNGAKVLSGTVATINGVYMTITGTDGTDYSVRLDSTTVYSKIAAAKASDLKVGQAVTVAGTKGSNGSINAQAVTILLALSANGE